VISADTLHTIELTVNRVPVREQCHGRLTLADFLRDKLRLTGTHLGCEHGVCGACTVMVDGSSVRSCLMLAVQAHGSAVTTVEGLSTEGKLVPLQEAFRARHALQCGFCTAGMLTTAQAFLDETPVPTAESVRMAISGNICRCTGYVPIVEAILDVARARTGAPKAHRHHADALNGKFVGQAVPRIEDARFLTGRGVFIDDLNFEGTAHAIMVRSTHAHARIVRIHSKDIRMLPGVVDVFTAEDIAEYSCEIPIRLGPLPGFQRFLQRPLASSVVRYVGEPLAVIVAESRQLAEDALELFSVEYEALDPVTDIAQALADRSIVHDSAGTNLATNYHVADGGDIDAAFAAAEYTRKETFRCHRQTATPLETRGLLAVYEQHAQSPRLRVWGASKVTYFNRQILSNMLRLPKEAVELIEVDVGGGFGARGEFYPEDFLVPFAAMRLGRPVKWIEDRREHFMATNHSREGECDLEIAMKRDGTILGLRGWIRTDMGAYIRTNGGVVPSKAAQFIPGPYRIPSLFFEVKALITNKTPIGTFRGPGLFEGNFYRERLIDLAAADLGLTPVEIRLRNLILTSEMPYQAPKLVPHEPSDAYDSGDFTVAFQRALDEIGYESVLAKAAEGGNIRHGIGLCCFVESTGAGPYEFARVTLADDGQVTVIVGISASGQGHETVFAQVAADELGMSPQDIAVAHGTTGLVEHSFGTFHSRGAVMAGSAVLLAARQMRERMVAVAARRLNVGTDEIELRDGAVHRCLSDGREAAVMSLKALAAAAREMEPGGESSLVALEETAKFEQKTKTFAYGTHVAHVAVDIETGKVEVVRYIVVEDIGRSINPLITHGQVIGGAVQGIGSVFLDEIVYDADGQLLTGSFADYLVATSTEFPNIEAISLDLAPSTLNPLGVKGAGEGGIVATGGAIANAISHALAPLGVQITALPLNPNNIRRLLRGAGH
jgi:aerobic carbon-monoxide dehydrogenase large subunit